MRILPVHFLQQSLNKPPNYSASKDLHFPKLAWTGSYKNGISTNLGYLGLPLKLI